MLGQQEQMVSELKEIKGDISVMKGDISVMKGDISDSKRLHNRQEEILMHILEALEDDVPKFDELIELEKVQDDKVVLRKTK